MDKNKEFLYKVNKLKTTENAPIVEGIIKAFGLIKNTDTTLSENDIAQFEAIEQLEAIRNGNEPKAFFESIAANAMKNSTKENIRDVRAGLNAYKTWLDKNA